jgi:hypothetical protein
MDERLASALAREKALLTAVFAGDQATMRRAMLPDGLGVDGDFGHARQAELIAGIGRLTDGAFHIADAFLVDAGAGAEILIYTLYQSGRSHGAPIAPRVRCSTLWTRASGAWQAAFHQETVPAP